MSVNNTFSNKTSNLFPHISESDNLNNKSTNVTNLLHQYVQFRTENLTPWTTVLALFLLYLITLLWMCKHGKNICHPTPDSIYPYIGRLKRLKRALDHLLVDDINIELTDIKLGQGAVGFVFKGYVVPKSQTRFKQKMFAAVKMSYPMPQKSIGLLEEAARMARLNHANIVRIIAVSKLSFSAFRPMFAMEWLPGGSLAEFFREEIRCVENERERPRVFVRDIVHVLGQVGNALKFLHESRDLQGNEFAHGDVAARNILLTERNLSRCVAKLGDFGLPIDFGPRLPIPWLPPEIVCSLDRTNAKHRPESDAWMFGVLCWECATLGAEPHYQQTFDEICDSFQRPHRGLPLPEGCPADYAAFVMDCFSEQHRRPRFAGPMDVYSSAIRRLRHLTDTFKHSRAHFKMEQNVSMCTCAQHRCAVPLPVFSLR
uniref:Protein kinase domain-containing protein n=1 Tax=Globodera rostochiensis TaxID=31243 RepID=A0A914HBX3_GLORO